MASSDPQKPYATLAATSRGRLHAEPEAENRTPFQRDRDRIIHATAFRRLKHKTQVFVYHEGDHYRTRLTHSLEVAQIARSLARALGLNEDLAEALSLAHDLGHTPFGHAGEEALDAAMADYGGFDHNAQTLRILTQLEQKYAAFDGLNLTWETLEGVVKHNGPLVGPDAIKHRDKPLPAAIVEYNRLQDLEIDTWPGAEAQIAALSDDIAYNNHDIDDGLRAGLFSIGDICAVPIVLEVVAEVRHLYPNIDDSRLIHETTRRLIDRMIRDVLAESTRRLDQARPATVAEIRHLGRPLIAFSAEMSAADRRLKDFLFERMYRHYRVNRMTSKARRVVRQLFELLFDEPECLPPDWQARARNVDARRRARLVADYIAGMTDRFALKEHRRLFDAYE